MSAVGFAQAAENNPSGKKLDLKPLWHPLKASDQNGLLETKESIVSINGTQYRKIESENGIYYLRMTQTDNTAAHDDLICGSPAYLVQNPQLMEASIKTSKRTRAFIEGLTKRCDDKHLNRAVVDPNPQIGIAIRPRDPNGAEKKIYVNPVKQETGFKTQF